MAFFFFFSVSLFKKKILCLFQKKKRTNICLSWNNYKAGQGVETTSLGTSFCGKRILLVWESVFLVLRFSPIPTRNPGGRYQFFRRYQQCSLKRVCFQSFVVSPLRKFKKQKKLMLNLGSEQNTLHEKFTGVLGETKKLDYRLQDY